MAETFDYVSVASEYSNFKKIVGDEGDPSSVAGILHTANQDVEKMVNIENEAIFGNLGSQLKLDWDNFSSNFPTFVAKFNDWAALVAQTGTQYQEMEQKIAEMQAESGKLGFAGRGLDSNYIVSSAYQQYYNDNIEQFKTDVGNLGDVYALTAADYTNTNTVALYEGHKSRVHAADGFAAAAAVVAVASTVAYFTIGAGGAGAAGTEIATTGGGGGVGGGGAAAPTASLLGDGTAATAGQAVSISEFEAAVAANGSAEQIAAVSALKEAGVTQIVSNGNGVVQFINGSGQVVGATTYSTAASTAAAGSSTFAGTTSTMGAAATNSGGFWSSAAATGGKAWSGIKAAGTQGASFIKDAAGAVQTAAANGTLKGKLIKGAIGAGAAYTLYEAGKKLTGGKK